jgi:hypothetical protein
MRPQFMALRDLPEDQRPAAREKVWRRDAQQDHRHADAGQRAKYEAVQAQAASARVPAGRAGPRRSGQGRYKKSIAIVTHRRWEGAKKIQKMRPVAAAATPPERRQRGRKRRQPLRCTRCCGAQRWPPAPAARRAGPGAGAAPLPAPGAPGANATEFRNRLVAELALTPAQVEKVDAIYADARPKLRHAARPARGAAQGPRAHHGRHPRPHRRRADARAEAEIRRAGGEAASRQSTRGRIYLLGEDGKPKAYNVRLGITDGTSTELIVGPGSARRRRAEGRRAGHHRHGCTPARAQAPRRAPAGPRMPF